MYSSRLRRVTVAGLCASGDAHLFVRSPQCLSREFGNIYIYSPHLQEASIRTYSNVILRIHPQTLLTRYGPIKKPKMYLKKISLTKCFDHRHQMKNHSPKKHICLT